MLVQGPNGNDATFSLAPARPQNVRNAAQATPPSRPARMEMQS